jgi:toxin ParE1/3/4
MMRRLVLSLVAERDFDAILAYIAKDKPGTAVRFVEKLRAKCLPLAENPFVGEDCSLLRPRMRRITHAGYLIFYRVDETSVEIVRVVHGARDWQDLL